MNMRIQDVEKVCACCGKIYIGAKWSKYCKSCAEIARIITNRVGYKKHKQERTVLIDIQISDARYVQNCGWDDCETCPYPDCILKAE